MRILLVLNVVAAAILPELASAQTLQLCASFVTVGNFEVGSSSITGLLRRHTDVVKAGDALDQKTVDTLRSAAESIIADEADIAEGSRFVLNATSVTCKTRTGTQRVDVLAHIDHLQILEGDTAGSVLDDRFLVRPNVTPQPIRFFGRFDDDPAAGNALGLHFGLHSAAGGSLGTAASSEYNFWKSLDDEFYRFSGDAVFSIWTDHVRGWHLGGQGHYWFESVPFGDNALGIKGLWYGFSSEKQRGSLNARGNFGLRFASAGLTGTNLDGDKWKELALETSWHQEFVTYSGFAQVTGWADWAHVYGRPAYARAAGSFRTWEDFRSLLTADLTLSAGTSGGAPEYRLFRAGSRMDPILGQRVTVPADFSLAGPELRGFGVGGLGVVNTGATTLSDVGGTAFQGASLTVSLPGFTRSLLHAPTKELRSEVQQQVTAAFVTSASDKMSELLGEGLSIDQAIAISEAESQELGRTLQNILTHGNRVSARPILIADWARLAGTESGTAWSTGIGFRVATPNWGVEAVVMRNRLFEGARSSTGDKVFMLRARFGTLFGL